MIECACVMMEYTIFNLSKNFFLPERIIESNQKIFSDIPESFVLNPMIYAAAIIEWNRIRTLLIRARDWT